MELDKQYFEIFQLALAEIKTARISIARQVNTAAMGVYWNLGKLLSERKIEKGHGAGVVNRLSFDLKAEFPDMGLSPRNLWDMKRFYEQYKDASPKLRQAVAVLPWGHNLLLTQALRETELEQRLVEKIKQFILELGKGFTFIGNQYRLEYNRKEYFVDILLYHRGLRCLVALELKIGRFKPEYVGKMNFYLGLLDKLEKQAEENPSIGIILCADKDHLDVEIALQDINKPIGIAEYKLLLPTKELETMLMQELNNFNREKEDEDEQHIESPTE